MQKRLLSTSILSIILTACGGGGSLDATTHVPNDKKSDDGIVTIQDKTNIKKVDTDNHDHTHSDGSTTGGNNGSTTGGNNGSTTGGNNNANVAFKVPTTEEIEAHNQLMQPVETEDTDNTNVEYGYSLPAPYTGGLASYLLSTKDNGSEQLQANASIDTNKATTDTTAENYDTLTFVNSPYDTYQSKPEKKTVTITKEGFTSDPYIGLSSEPTVFDGELHQDIQDNLVIVADNGTFDALKMIEFDHTKAGAVFYANSADGTKYGNLFFKGKDPSTKVPTQGTAEYNGVWEVARAMEISTDYAEPLAGYGTGELNSRSPVRFNVNFAEKSINGEFKKNLANGRAFAYTLSDGRITGNTFTATANSTDDATNEDTAQVTGGFFGEQASELAGKLISEKAFGVFAAKQTSNDNLVIPEPKKLTQAKATLLDAHASSVNELTTDFDDIFKATEKLDKLDSITINGVKIDLNGPNQSNIFANEPNLPLQFTRAGLVPINNQYALFYQGQLTQDMPVEGSAKYQGNWVAYGQPSDGSSSYWNTKRYDTKFDFTANFADKSLSGSFKTPSGNDGMTLDGVTITGNTFKGMANIVGSGLSHDDGIGGRPIKGSVNVSGAFFGPKANELGGGFHKEDHSFAGVFAGKQVK